jgi:hypothetical protein
MDDKKVKATFMLSTKAKEKLEGLKGRLRKAGVPRNVANESAILEFLVLAADKDFEWLLGGFQ